MDGARNTPTSEKAPFPLPLKVVVIFLCCLSVLEPLPLILGSGQAREAFVLRILFSVVSAAVGLQLALALPLARFGALLLLVGYPAVVGFRYVLFPYRWELLDDLARFQQFFTVAAFLFMAFLLTHPACTRYLKEGARGRTDKSEEDRAGVDSPAKERS